MAIRYYVRVSTMEQKADRQLLAYPSADFIYIDKMSGKTKDRPELQRLLSDMKAGDTIIAKSLDRLSRSVKDLLEIVEEIKQAGANLKILDMAIDTSTPMGECFMMMAAAFSELERKTIIERSKEGVAIAKAAGKYKGRKKGAIALQGDALKRFIKFYGLGMNKTDLSKEYNVPRSTIYRWIAELKQRELIK